MREWNGRTWTAPLGVEPGRPPKGQRQGSGKWVTNELEAKQWVPNEPPVEPEFNPEIQEDPFQTALQHERKLKGLRKRVFGPGFTKVSDK